MRAVALLLLSLIPLFGCSSETPMLKASFSNPQGNSSPQLALEVADTPGKRALGLMYRQELAESRGMFFAFPQEEAREFWMKNTYIPLDIIYLNRELAVVSVVERAEPLTESPRPSGEPAQYVVEVGAGLAAKWGVGKGSKLVVDGDVPSGS